MKIEIDPKISSNKLLRVIIIIWHWVRIQSNEILTLGQN